MYALRLDRLVRTLMHTRKGKTYVKITKYQISIPALHQSNFREGMEKHSLKSQDKDNRRD